MSPAAQLITPLAVHVAPLQVICVAPGHAHAPVAVHWALPPLKLKSSWEARASSEKNCIDSNAKQRLTNFIYDFPRTLRRQCNCGAMAQVELYRRLAARAVKIRHSSDKICDVSAPRTRMFQKRRFKNDCSRRLFQSGQ
jgi:hypothetical protein